MSPTNSLLHALKDQIRTVKYSIRAEAHTPGSMVPRALQSREVRRLTTLGSVVSTPAFRLVDGIVTRVETLALDWLGTSPRAAITGVEPIGAYVADGFDFTDKLFVLLKQVVDTKGAPSVFVSEQALDATWTIVAKALPQAGAGVDPVLACAVVAEAVARTQPIRQLGYRPGAPETHFSAAPSLYCGLLTGLMIAVATTRPSVSEEGAALLESSDSAVNVRFDRFRRAMDGDAPADAVAAEYRKLIPFLP